jgi:hypothetical protein
MFWMLYTVMAPVKKPYDCTQPSKRFIGFWESTTTTEVPTKYASSVPTVIETEPAKVGRRVTAEVVWVA